MGFLSLLLQHFSYLPYLPLKKEGLRLARQSILTGLAREDGLASESRKACEGE